MTSNDTSAAEAMRREFEQWKKGPRGLGLGLSRNNTPGSDLDGYQDFFVQGQWVAWQAAESSMRAKIDAAVLAEREACKELCREKYEQHAKNRLTSEAWTARSLMEAIDARTTNKEPENG